MNELNEEIKLTLNLMQSDIDDGAHSELQNHLYNLLEMKRDVLQQRLVERSLIDNQTPYESGPIIGRAEPLTIEELEAGGWWCADISKECAEAFKSKGLRVFNAYGWGSNGTWDGCVMGDEGNIIRASKGFAGKKQIHRIGLDFYWSKQ